MKLPLSWFDRLRARLNVRRTRWVADRVRPWLKEGEDVINIGAGEGFLEVILQREVGCRIVPVEVMSSERAVVPLVIYDGEHLPFPDDSFDKALVLFVLHHARDPVALLREARRVTRGPVIVFEDRTEHPRDRYPFLLFHHYLHRVRQIPLRHRHSLAQWQDIARQAGFQVTETKLFGAGLGPLVSRHLAMVLERAASSGRVSS